MILTSNIDGDAEEWDEESIHICEVEELIHGFKGSLGIVMSQVKSINGNDEFHENAGQDTEGAKEYHWWDVAIADAVVLVQVEEDGVGF